jgi:hypothetical protein
MPCARLVHPKLLQELDAFVWLVLLAKHQNWLLPNQSATTIPIKFLAVLLYVFVRTIMSHIEFEGHNPLPLLIFYTFWSKSKM